MALHKWLASLALTVVAFAIPATASAGWTDDTEPITEDQTVELKGFFSYEALGTPFPTTFGCQVHIPIVLTATGEGTDGHVEDFVVTTETCEGTGIFAGCEVAEEQLTNLPWTVDNNIEDLAITSATLDFKFTASCPVGQIQWTFPKVTLVPDDPDAIGSVTLSGLGENKLGGGPGAITGGLAVTPGGTYGLT